MAGEEHLAVDIDSIAADIFNHSFNWCRAAILTVEPLNLLGALRRI